MNAGKTVFAQVLEHLPRYEFDKCVKNTRAIIGSENFPVTISFSALPSLNLRTGKA
jgi:hypothetical protein